MLNKKQSIIFLSIYGALTMIARLFVEYAFHPSALTSLFIGAICLGALVLLFKFGVLTLGSKQWTGERKG